MNIEYGITNFIYGLEDIGVSFTKSSDSDYVDYLCNKCYYSCLKTDDYFGIRNELNRIAHKYYYYNFKRKIFEVYQEVKITSHTINGEMEKDRTSEFEYDYVVNEPQTSSYSATTETILYDWDHRTLDDFLKCSQWNKSLENTKYIYRMEKEWDD